MPINHLKWIITLTVACLINTLYLPSAFGICIGLGCGCTVSAETTQFGHYSPFNTSPTDTTSNIQITCTVSIVGLNASYEIELSAGNAASFSPRKMHSGAHTLNYNLYTAADYATVWGDGTGSTSKISDSYSLPLVLYNVRHYIVHGRIPALQNAAVGTYSDTITVTVTY